MKNHNTQQRTINEINLINLEQYMQNDQHSNASLIIILFLNESKEKKSTMKFILYLNKQILYKCWKLFTLMGRGILQKIASGKILKKTKSKI